MYDVGKIDAVARSLAFQDDRFIAAEQWAGRTGMLYRLKAVKILETIERYDAGQQSGGLPEAFSVEPHVDDV
jgi:hypothetical protein